MTHNTALLIIACQNDHFPGGKFELPKQIEAAKNIVELLENARQHNEFVIHIKHVYKDPNSPYMAEGSFGADINNVVAPRVEEAIVTKYYFDSFVGTDLKLLLDQHKIDDLVICGSMTQFCIVETARTTLDLGYPVTVVFDACAASAMEFRGREVSVDDVQASIMASLIFTNANVLSTDEFLNHADISAVISRSARL